MILGEWRAHPGRVVLAALAIAIGVALGFAVHLINASALNEFARAVRSVNGDADLQVHSVSALGFDETLYAKLAKLPGIADASPAVELRASAGASEDVSFTLIGLDIFRAGAATPSLLPRRTEAQAEDVFDPNALYLSDAALEAIGKHPGDSVDVSAAGRTISLAIAGTLPAVAEGQRIGVMDIASAQWRFGQLGRLQRIDLKLAEGGSPARIRDTLSSVLPADAELVSEETQARRTDSLSRAYRVNLDMLALMALLSGTFLVYSAQSLSVARRRSEFALLRVLGMQKRALLIQVLAEGSIVGCIGALLGLGLGVALAGAALQLLGGDLGGGYFEGTRPALILAPEAAVAFFVLGLVAALIGGLLPARDAARAQPAIALKQVGDAADPKSAPVARLAAVLLVAGALAAYFPPIGGLPLFGYVSIALLLAGGIAAMPWLARKLLAPLRRVAFASLAVDLAIKRLWGAPSQAAIALCGIVASISLMIAMAVMVASFRASVDDWLLEILPSDLYLRVEDGDSGAFDAEMQRRLAATPGVVAIDFRRATALRLSPDRPPIALMTRAIDRSDPEHSLPLIESAAVPKGAIPVWVSEPAVRLYHYQAGDWITLPIVSKLSDENPAGQRVFVAGVWRDYGRQQGAIAMDGGDYTRLTGDAFRTDAAIELAPDASAQTVVDAMRDAVPKALAGRLIFAEPREIRALSLRIFDRSFAVTYLLEGVAMLVGLAGIAATFSAQTLARRKEFGMLRHVGVLRRQIVAMLIAEGALLGAVGVAAGLLLGVAISQVLIHVVNPQSFHWTMQTRLPFALFASVTITLIGAAATTALLAGRRALSADAVKAVREDW